MLNRDFAEILSAFTAERVEYLVVGAYALAAHGLPRATGDIDLWVRPTSGNAERVWSALATFGAPLDRLTRADLQDADAFIRLGTAPNAIDLLTNIPGVTFDEAFAARTTLTLDGIPVPTLSREHLIRAKRAAGRPQDLADVSRLEEQE